MSLDFSRLIEVDILNINQSKIPCIIQSNTNEKLQIKLKEKKELYNLTGCKVKYEIVKPNGNTCEGEVDIIAPTSGFGIIYLTEGILDIVGVHKINLDIITPNQQIKVKGLKYEVISNEDNFNNDVVDSEEDTVDKNNIVSEESSDSDINNSTTVGKDITYVTNEVSLIRQHELDIDFDNLSRKSSNASFMLGEMNTSEIIANLKRSNISIDLTRLDVSINIKGKSYDLEKIPCEKLDAANGKILIKIPNKFVDEVAENSFNVYLQDGERILKSPTFTYKTIDTLQDGIPGNDIELSYLQAKIVEVQQMGDTIEDLKDKFNKTVANVTNGSESATNTEIVLARGDKVTLGERLDENEGKLSDLSKPVISFCFDDGFEEDNLTYSIFKEFGFTCSFALITEYAMTRNRLELYRKYEREGFSMNSHSCTHLYLGDGTVDDNIANYEIEESKKHMNAWGFPANGFVAGQSVVHDKYIQLLKENYDYAFSQYWGTLNASNKGYCNNKSDIYKLGRVSLYRNTTEQIKECIDNCIKNNSCLFFYDHRTGATGENVSESKLREILTYIKLKHNEGKCLVMNNDDAVKSYFGANLKNRINSKIAYNVAPSLENKSDKLDFGSWCLSIHELNLGEVYSFSNDIAKISYPNIITANKENSLQTKIDISNIDFNYYENQSITVSLEMWTNKDADLKVTLESRFYKDLDYDLTHVKEIKVNTKRRRFDFTISPTKKQSFDYLLLYPRLKAMSDIDAGLEVYIGDIRVGITNEPNAILENKISKLKKGLAYTKTLDISGIGNRVWSKYSATVDSDLYEGVSDGTLKMKNDGIYMFTIEGFYNLTGVTNNSRVLMRVLKSTDENIENNYRTIGYVNGTSGIVNLSSSYIINCIKNNIINVEVFLDSSTGTVTELEKARIRVEFIS